MTVDGGGRDRLAEDDPGDADGRPAAPPALAVSPASLSFSGDGGRREPGGEDVSVTNTGGGTLDWTASDDATLADGHAGERHERRRR